MVTLLSSSAMIVSSTGSIWECLAIGKLEDASENQGSSSWATATSKYSKKFLVLYELRLLQAALISKTMVIKSPVVDVLYIQENKAAIIQSKRTMNVK